MTFWRRCLERCLQRLEGLDILEEVLAVFWRGCGIFGGNVLEGCGISEVLAEFWRDVAFMRGAWRVWHFGVTCSVLEGCGILEGC